MMRRIKIVAKRIFQKARTRKNSQISQHHVTIIKHKSRINELNRIQLYDLTTLNRMVREFLKEMYHIKPGSTTQEIKAQLEKKKVDGDTKRRLILFLEKIDQLRYDKNDCPEIAAVELAKTFEKIIDEIHMMDSAR